MSTTYQDRQISKDDQPQYSANNPYAFAEQHGQDLSINHGKFDNGVYIPYQDYSAVGHDHQDDQHQMTRPHRTTNPKGTSPSLMRSQFVCISDLHWWTSHFDILQVCHHAGVTLPRDAITSAEHKVNGKTKGCVYVTCKSEDDAKIIVNWFQQHEFQGKRMASAFASKDAIRALRTPAAISSNPRPAGGLSSLANHPPTNAHGGINFNRLRQHGRTFGANAHTAPMGSLAGRHGLQKDVQMTGWPHPHPWVGMENYQIPQIYHPMHAGMLPYMHTMDQHAYGVQGEVQY